MGVGSKIPDHELLLIQDRRDSVHGETNLDGHLPMADFAVLEMAPNVVDLEPTQAM
jgi:hypothetical protein